MRLKVLPAALCLAGALSLAPLAARAQEGAIPAQSVNEALRARLPAEIRQAGELVAVNNGSFPPYEIVINATTMRGASADLAEAVGQVLGLRLRHETVSGLSAMLAGIKAGRYQMAIGPIGDFPERQAANDFVDFVREYVVFAVHAGNPAGIRDLADTCGKKVAVMAAGSAERVIKQQSAQCVAAGKPAVEVQSYTDQPTSILAVRSGRAEAFFSSQAPLTYFVQQAKGELELAATGRSNGFGDLYQGSVVPKDGVLRDVLLATYQQLFDNGTYAAIMKKWGLEGNMIPAPGVNLAGKPAQ
ncbi:ABC transporter substrate-binding protein [Roseomonas sp. GC11]|uniref:ABC transporter substrate-binding protein n=1 Tax=Roseomonas sp. GC11 TaxID=2950546 RepID=UPI0021095163|nr:ABC transporter substrate-binding protein [Roseomonas sp. GC11]MCQ4161828.1 ABC transporter substrate-binding protein [Roseomonas sp. GC11]